MSDKEYIKDLEEKISMMEKVVEGKDAEIQILKKNYSLPSAVAKRMEKKHATTVDVNSFSTKITFKFSMSSEELQDIFSMYEGTECIDVLEKAIIEAAKGEIAKYVESSDKKLYP
jgi:hypothetical protein